MNYCYWMFATLQRFCEQAFSLGGVGLIRCLPSNLDVDGSIQHHLETRPGHRSLATSQTSELVGKAPKTCNSYPDAFFK